MLYGIAITPDDKTVIVADYQSDRIRAVDRATGDVTTLAGSYSGKKDGTGTNAQFWRPSDVTLTRDGAIVFVADYENSRILQFNRATGAVTTLAGSVAGFRNDIGTKARFDHPLSVAITPDRLTLVVSDSNNHQIRQITRSTADVTTLAGVHGRNGFANGIGSNALFNYPCWITVTPDGVNAVVADKFNNQIRKINRITDSVSTLAGSITRWSGTTDGVGTKARFTFPTYVKVTTDGSTVMVVGTLENKIRYINIETGATNTLNGAADKLSSVRRNPTL